MHARMQSKAVRTDRETDMSWLVPSYSYEYICVCLRSDKKSGRSPRLDMKSWFAWCKNVKPNQPTSSFLSSSLYAYVVYKLASVWKIDSSSSSSSPPKYL